MLLLYNFLYIPEGFETRFFYAEHINMTWNRNALLRITDGKGEVLYNERFTGKEFSRMIQVSPEELNSIEVVMDAAEGTSRKRYNLNVTKVQAFQIEEVVSK